MKRWTWPGIFAAMMAMPGAAHAVGIEGDEASSRRAQVGVGTGWDQVGGYGQDGYAFAEIGGEYEARIWKRLTLRGAASLRQDLANYNQALQDWRQSHTAAVAAQLTLGWDWPRIHASVGSWIYGAARDRKRFRLGFLPLLVARLRFGHQDGWNVQVRLVDGSPFTAEGAAALRVMLALAPRGRHRIASGLYTTLGEKVIGPTAIDEILLPRPWMGAKAIRVGASVGTDWSYATRFELLLHGGLVF